MDDIRPAANPAPSEQDDFNRLASRAIHLQGLLGAFLQLNPDTSSAKQIEEMVIPMLKRLHHAETSVVENDQTITLLRHDIANLKVTISTLRDRVELHRRAIILILDPAGPLTPEMKVACDELLAMHDVP